MLKYLVIMMAGYIGYIYASEEQLEDILNTKKFTAGNQTYIISINKKFIEKLTDKANQELLWTEIQSIKNKPPKDVDWIGFVFRPHKGKWQAEPIPNYLIGY